MMTRKSVALSLLKMLCILLLVMVVMVRSWDDEAHKELSETKLLGFSEVTIFLFNFIISVVYNV